MVALHFVPSTGADNLGSYIEFQVGAHVLHGAEWVPSSTEFHLTILRQCSRFVQFQERHFPFEQILETIYWIMATQ